MNNYLYTLNEDSGSQFIDYHINFGQSNSAGRSNVSDLVGGLAYLSSPITNNGNSAFIINKAINDTIYQVVEAGVNTSDAVDLFGIQPKLAFDMISYKNEDFNLIQCAFGGTTIDLYSYGSVNFQWILDQALAARLDAQSKGKTARFVSATFIQGESNGGDGTGIYQGLLEDLIRDLRIYLQSPDLAFIVVQMIDCQTSVVNLSELQTAQANAVANTSNTFLIPKDVSDTCSDPLHFSTTKYLDVSDEIFNIIKDL